MTRDDLFAINAGNVASLIEGVAKHCPNVRSPSLSRPTSALLSSPSWVCGFVSVCVCMCV